MKYLLGIFLFVSAVYGQKEAHFGFKFQPDPNGGQITYAIVYVENEKIVSSTPLDHETFMKMISGVQISEANPERKNLIVENYCPNCYILWDENLYKYGKKKYEGYECFFMENLWRLRYPKHPVDLQLNDGWAKGAYKPSEKQKVFLQEKYGFNSLVEYIYGDNMWQLFRDISIDSAEKFKIAYEQGDLRWKPQANPMLKKQEEEKKPEPEKPQGKIEGNNDKATDPKKP